MSDWEHKINYPKDEPEDMTYENEVKTKSYPRDNKKVNNKY